ncbi:hydantoinase/oxoprolinase family protein [Stieleria varia]|uniref:hydantoinase/oxoprolinase family protein n=1 Tax=Stieleria varia TaxID=2528005 RepID=UPI0018D2066B|nr:hydantoinase/oxoprolinase family protein [Stieleria varia]
MTFSRSSVAAPVVGIDIGGANLKYASSGGKSFSREFAMWKHHRDLSETLVDDLSRFGKGLPIAVTMTGELADCFLDREIGVRHIVESVEQATRNTQTRYYSVTGEFFNAAQAVARIDDVAASNWHALATLVAGEVCSDAMLVDIGSTTTDIVPLSAGRVATPAKTDHDRLVEGSLVYVGCARTPVCALVNELQYQGENATVMNEWFATVDDARVVLGLEKECPGDRASADNAPRDAFHARNRLARMIGLDHRSVDDEAARTLATQIMAAARERIQHGIRKVQSLYGFAPNTTLVLSGHGGDLLPRDVIADRTVIRLDEQWGEVIARSAPAYAVARLMTAVAVRD